MQDVDTLIKIIIPAILLIFWLLSNLFNRENAQKAARERTAVGNRPSNYPSARPVDRRNVPAGRPSSQNDEVMIIRAEPKRPPAKTPPPGRKNQTRGRAAGGQPGRRNESTAASQNRVLTGGALVSDVNQSLTRPLEMKALGDQLASESTPPAVTSSLTTGTPPASALDLRGALKDPTRVREAFILIEVLQPPVSQRGKSVRSLSAGAQGPTY